MTTKKNPVSLSTFAVGTPAATVSVPIPAASNDKIEMRQKVFRLTPAQDRRLKEFCAHSDLTIQDVVIEGINLVLKQRGLPQL